MKVPSRRMPRIEKKYCTKSGITLFLLALIGGWTALFYYRPGFAVYFTGIVYLFYIWAHSYSLESTRQKRRIRASRHHESICTFARSFDKHAIDSWVIRAVYEEIGELIVCKPNETFPLRPTDDIIGLWNCDPEDLEETVQIIAKRCVRSLDDYKINPHYGTSNTVGGLVQFFNAQPKVEAA